MSNDKRSRGRPRGPGKDDSPTLRKVADMLAGDPLIKPTTAMKRTLEKPDETTLRRLQVKWKQSGAEYLANARARRVVAVAPARRTKPAYTSGSLRHMAEAHRKLNDVVGPGIRAAQDLMNSPAIAAAQEAFRHYREDPAMRAITEMRNSPAMRAMEAIQNDPTVRAMRELQNSPEMRVYREMEAARRLLDGY